MRIFSLILPDKVIEYRCFFWLTRRAKRLGLFVRLIGFKVDEQEINPVYQPIFTFESISDRKMLEIHILRWKSYVVLLDKAGLHGRWFDIRKSNDMK